MTSGSDHENRYIQEILRKEENDTSKWIKCCKTFAFILYCPFLLCLIIITQILQQIHLMNVVFTIITCITMFMNPLSVDDNIIMYHCLSFIIRNVVHILVLKHWLYTFNTFRLLYNFCTNIAFISIAVYHIFRMKDEMNLLIVLITMSSILILCDLWMISSLTIKPNKLYNKYFDVKDELLTDLQYVGKHASEIPLNNIAACIQEMKRIYQSNLTRRLSERKDQLKNLVKLLKENEQSIYDALMHDFGRNDFISGMFEIHVVVGDIERLINNLEEAAAPQKMPPSIVTFPSTDYYVMEPYGTVFVHGIWNFPFTLTLMPLAGAISAGNNVVVKVPNDCTKSAHLICDLLHKYMDSRFVQCAGHPSIGNDREITSTILENEFDLIFFTGSTNGGKYIQRQASNYMTPVILECGGKNPCFVDDSADIRAAAKTIINARLVNAGQLCMCPDYVLIYKNVLDEFLSECNAFIHKHYKMGDELHTDLGVNQSKLINKQQFDRVLNMLKRSKGEIICGGNYDEDTLMIEPTIVLLPDIENVLQEATIKEETFGPILWIVPISSNRIQDAVRFVRMEQQKSLSLYIFTENRAHQNFIVHNTSSGGVQVNGCVVYSGHHHALFGGIGASGMGNYKGMYSFYSFSHKKPVIVSWLQDNIFVQPPYDKWKKWLISSML